MHEIRYLTFGARMTPKGIQRECDRVSRTCGEYHDNCPPIRFFPEVVLKSEDEAMQWIDDHDKGWYDCIAVKFKENRRLHWMAKIEYHV